METVTLSSKYQLVIPKKVREALDLRPGSKLAVIRKGGILYLVPELPMKTSRGMAKGLDPASLRDKKDRL